MINIFSTLYDELKNDLVVKKGDVETRVALGCSAGGKIRTCIMSVNSKFSRFETFSRYALVFLDLDIYEVVFTVGKDKDCKAKIALSCLGDQKNYVIVDYCDDMKELLLGLLKAIEISVLQVSTPDYSDNQSTKQKRKILRDREYSLSKFSEIKELIEYIDENNLYDDCFSCQHIASYN